MTQDELNAALAASPSPDRVTEEYLKSKIKHVDHYNLPGGTMTVCVITLDNGFQVTGESACADPANYNREIGNKISYDNAERKIWPLLGFALKEAMAARDAAKPPADYRDRVRAERDELFARLEKLRAFLGVKSKPELDDPELRRLQRQRACMGAYLDVLDERIEAFPK